MKEVKGPENRKVPSGELSSNRNNLLSWNWELLRLAVRVVSYREKYLKPALERVQKFFPLTMTRARLIRPERIALSHHFKNFFLT